MDTRLYRQYQAELQGIQLKSSLLYDICVKW